MKTENIILDDAVCDFCNPDHEERLSELVSHLLDPKGNWIGGWTKEKSREYDRIREEFQKDLRKPCLCLCEITGHHICGKHLLEVVARMM